MNVIPESKTLKQKNTQMTAISTDPHNKTLTLSSFELQFNPNAYNEEFLSKFMTKSAFNDIINEINHISIQAFFQAKKERGSIYPYTWKIILAIVILSIVMMIIGSFQSIHLAIPSILIFSINALIIILIVLIYKKPITHLSKPDLFIQKTIDNYLKEINTRYLNVLKWEYEPFKKNLLITLL